ncbi:hypothetical protein [Spirosoma pollinicola]|uniref:Uncharacterized protein n=1 Tax=Spirosoma pollinicola TaxID=2057025 RepID=A0A2K8YT95_9BACT|nr:hypothetical protein [Spirosoma pollinicola]AUD00846.1 hypothetical protein CWM47_02850 [Spirosoma pollinicola]
MNFDNKSPQSVIESLHQAEWTINGFKIVFLFAEQVLSVIKSRSLVTNWDEDPIATDPYLDRLKRCFISVQQYHMAFGSLPQIGDRLYDEDTGMKIQDRSIDGNLRTITFTLSL